MIRSYPFPSSLGGGTIEVQTLTVQQMKDIEQSFYGKAKSDDEAGAVFAAMQQAKYLKSFAGRNRKAIAEPDREMAYHELGPKGVQLLKAAFHAQHDVSEEDIQDFLGAGEPLEALG